MKKKKKIGSGKRKIFTDLEAQGWNVAIKGGTEGG